jgi:hypothetical protein
MSKRLFKAARLKGAPRGGKPPRQQSPPHWQPPFPRKRKAR